MLPVVPLLVAIISGCCVFSFCLCVQSFRRRLELQRTLRQASLTQWHETIPIGNLGDGVPLCDLTIPLSLGELSETMTQRHIQPSSFYLKARTQSVALLREWLNPQQLEQYDLTGTFTVFGEATGTCYLINGNMTMFNVAALDDDCVELCRLCFVPKGGLPIGDLLLAQKLALENDERSAFVAANYDACITVFAERVLSRLPEVQQEPELKRQIDDLIAGHPAPPPPPIILRTLTLTVPIR